LQQRRLTTPESMQRHRRKRRTTQINDNTQNIYESGHNKSIIAFEGTTNDISAIMHNNQSQDHDNQEDDISNHNNTESDSESIMSAASTHNTTLNTIAKDLNDLYLGKDT
jgi:hypothetical protein